MALNFERNFRKELYKKYGKCPTTWYSRKNTVRLLLRSKRQAKIPNRSPVMSTIGLPSFKEHSIFCFLLLLLFVFSFVMDLSINSSIFPPLLIGMKFCNLVIIRSVLRNVGLKKHFPYIVWALKMCDIIRRVRVATGYGGCDHFINHLLSKYANITREAVELFRSFCLKCQRKKKRPLIKGVCIKPAMNTHHVDHIDMQALCQGDNNVPRLPAQILFSEALPHRECK